MLNEALRLVSLVTSHTATLMVVIVWMFGVWALWTMPWHARKRRYIVAYWPWSWWLKWWGFDAQTMPWRTAYFLPETIDDPVLRAHEAIHFDQMDREGTFRFCVKYLWYAWKLGYHANPFEIEAYAKAEGNVR